jgi:membrane protease YdiL (CAAX protease family)
MATDFDPYRILGVDRTASTDDVRAAYDRLIAASPDGSAQRREAEAAYAVLGSAESRREYDERLAARETLGVAPPPPEAAALAGEPVGFRDVPWTPRDMALALILPLILMVLNVVTAVTSDVDSEDLSETEHVVGFAFGFVLEAALLGLALWFTVRKYRLSWRSLGFRWTRETQWWFPLAVVAASLATVYVWVLLLYLLDIEPESNIPSSVYDYVIPVIMLGILSVIVAPFVEEVFFRAFLFQGVARQWGMWAGIGVSGLIFGLAHVGDIDTWLILPAIAVIGGIFAWGFARTGSIYPSMIAHVLFNSLSFGLGFAE